MPSPRREPGFVESVRDDLIAEAVIRILPLIAKAALVLLPVLFLAAVGIAVNAYQAAGM